MPRGFSFVKMLFFTIEGFLVILVFSD